MLWVVRAGQGSIYYDKFLESLRVFIPWEGYHQDLTDKMTLPAFKEIVQNEKKTDNKVSISSWGAQLYAFVVEMQIGDYVLIPSKRSRSFTLATITGTYTYSTTDNDRLFHSRAMRIILCDIPREIFSQSVLYSLGAYRTIFRARYESEVLEAIKKRENNISNEIISLNAQTPSVTYLCKKDKHLASVISMVGVITYKPHEDSFRFLVSQIIGQMLSSKVAASIEDRLVKICGVITPDSILELSIEELRNTGISSRKIDSIRNLAFVVQEGHFSFDALSTMSDQKVIEQLTSLKGIGIWSAKMYLIFVLNRQDVLPVEDAAFIQAYKWVYKTASIDREKIISRCKKWKPYSSIAARYFYKAHDMGLTKTEFHLIK